MIHKVYNTVSKKINITERKCRDADCFDYSKVIVKKPWGYEYLMYENEHVAIWLLQIVRKKKTSMHCHPNKKTGLLLLSGNADFHHVGGKKALNMMDGVVIEKGAFHSTEAFNPLPINPVSENGIWVMEIETPPQKTDLVRMKDEYGRAGAKYEGTDNMVFEPRECLKFDELKSNEVVFKKHIGLVFSMRKGGFNNGAYVPSPDALVSVVGKNKEDKSDNPSLKVGELMTFKEFHKNIKNEDLNDCTILTIEKEKMSLKLSDYIFSFIEDLGVKAVFAVSGGGAMHLVDSLGRNGKVQYIATHHEQAAAMAAEGYARISGKPGVALVTSGPGGTNAITGVCGAWIDSIPSIFISGQVTTDTLIEDTGLRQFGIQESNIIDLVRPVTKYALTVKDPNMVRYHLEKAAHIAMTGRPGPVWLDIPLDVQSKTIDLNEAPSFTPDEVEPEDINIELNTQVSKSIEMLLKAKRPILISGYGIRLAKGEKEFKEMVDRLGIPVISSWTSSDLLSANHKYFVGRSGIFGDRAGNFAVQNADLLLIVGSRMSIPQVGYNYKAFAREAKKIMVDIDEKELNKPSMNNDLSIMSDAKLFLEEMLRQLNEQNVSIDVENWANRCRDWKKKYPVVLPEYKESRKYVNSFYFIDVLSRKLDNKAVVVTDMGTSFTCTMQTFKVKSGQRLFTSSGHSPMGFGLPGAIGACMANNRKKTICISGDGGLQMNIQELQTMVHYNLPIILFVLNNRGYLTIKLMQQNHFGKYVGSDPGSGVSCPDIVKVAKAYGIKADRIKNQKELHEKIDGVLSEPGPFVCEIIMPEDQPLIPRVSSMKKPDGTIISKPLEDLYPFLDRKEFSDNMIIESIEILK